MKRISAVLIGLLVFAGAGMAQAQASYLDMLPPEARQELQNEIRNQVQQAAQAEAERLREEVESDIEEQLGQVQVAGELLEYVVQLDQRVSASFGEVAPEAWRLSVRQQYVEGILFLVVPALLVLLLLIWPIFVQRFPIRTWQIFLFVVVVVACMALGIAKLVNPEYYAMMDLLSAVFVN